MREIVWRPRAALDLEGILAYIVVELKSPQAAKSCAEAIYEAVERAAELPGLGRPFEDDDLKREYRSVLAKNYRIFYSYDEKKLTVWRVFHASQDHASYGFEIFD